ncbi:MAG: hypothetical protein LBB18_00605 [Puniceicoccales bacterium]|jgi:predicted  nucleic acid-binding Zn-ribbon protein|nr:hypothetical protein [Puniceicoccales bacterium]
MIKQSSFDSPESSETPPPDPDRIYSHSASDVGRLDGVTLIEGFCLKERGASTVEDINERVFAHEDVEAYKKTMTAKVAKANAVIRDTETKYNQLYTLYNEVRAEADSVEVERDSLKVALKEKQSALEKALKKQGEATEETERLRKEVDSLKNQIRALGSEYAGKAREVSRQQEDLAKQKVKFDNDYRIFEERKVAFETSKLYVIQALKKETEKLRVEITYSSNALGNLKDAGLFPRSIAWMGSVVAPTTVSSAVAQEKEIENTIGLKKRLRGNLEETIASIEKNTAWESILEEKYLPVEIVEKLTLLKTSSKELDKSRNEVNEFRAKAQKLEKERAEIEQKYNEMSRETSALKEQILAKNSEIAKISAENMELRKKCTGLELEIQEKGRELDKKNNEIAKLTKRKDSLERELAEMKNSINNMLTELSNITVKTREQAVAHLLALKAAINALPATMIPEEMKLHIGITGVLQSEACGCAVESIDRTMPRDEIINQLDDEITNQNNIIDFEKLEQEKQAQQQRTELEAARQREVELERRQQLRKLHKKERIEYKDNVLKDIVDHLKDIVDHFRDLSQGRFDDTFANNVMLLKFCKIAKNPNAEATEKFDQTGAGMSSGFGLVIDKVLDEFAEILTQETQGQYGNEDSSRDSAAHIIPETLKRFISDERAQMWQDFVKFSGEGKPSYVRCFNNLIGDIAPKALEKIRSKLTGSSNEKISPAATNQQQELKKKLIQECDSTLLHLAGVALGNLRFKYTENEGGNLLRFCKIMANPSVEPTSDYDQSYGDAKKAISSVIGGVFYELRDKFLQKYPVLRNDQGAYKWITNQIITKESNVWNSLMSAPGSSYVDCFNKLTDLTQEAIKEIDESIRSQYPQDVN